MYNHGFGSWVCLKIHTKISNKKIRMYYNIAEMSQRRIDRMIWRRNQLDSIEYFDKHNIERLEHMETSIPWIMREDWNK